MICVQRDDLLTRAYSGQMIKSVAATVAVSESLLEPSDSTHHSEQRKGLGVQVKGSQQLKMCHGTKC